MIITLCRCCTSDFQCLEFIECANIYRQEKQTVVFQMRNACLYFGLIYIHFSAKYGFADKDDTKSPLT